MVSHKGNLIVIFSYLKFRFYRWSGCELQANEVGAEITVDRNSHRAESIK